MGDIEICRGCGVAAERIEGPRDPYNVPTPACWKMYCEVMAKEFSGEDYFGFHRYSADSYMVQHSSIASRAGRQSTWIYLVGLNLMLNYDGNAKFAGNVLGATTNGKKRLCKPGRFDDQVQVERQLPGEPPESG